MPRKCCINGCVNSKQKFKEGVTFHFFPKNEQRDIEWKHTIKVCTDQRIDDRKVIICSDHFHISDLIKTKNKVHLKNCAVPCVFNNTGFSDYEVLCVNKENYNPTVLGDVNKENCDPTVDLNFKIRDDKLNVQLMPFLTISDYIKSIDSATARDDDVNLIKVPGESDLNVVDASCDEGIMTFIGEDFPMDVTEIVDDVQTYSTDPFTYKTGISIIISVIDTSQSFEATNEISAVMTTEVESQVYNEILQSPPATLMDIENNIQENVTDTWDNFSGNRGGLIIPQVDILTICKEAEQIFWSTDLSQRYFYDRLFCRIKRQFTDKPLFSNMGHPSNEIECEHSLTLIKAVLNVYLKVRLHHVAKHHNINSKSKFIRAKLTKLVHFTHQ